MFCLVGPDPVGEVCASLIRNQTVWGKCPHVTAGPCVCLYPVRWLGGSRHISSAGSSLLAQRRQCLLDGVIKEVIDAIVIVTS